MNESGTVQIEERRGCTWIVLPDAVTIDSYSSIEEEVGRVLVGKNIRVVVDLSKTNDLFSSGLGLIILIRKKTLALDGTIFLVNFSRKIRSVLEAVRLDKVFALYATDVEFEISQEQFGKHFNGKEVGFVFIARIEDGVYRINLSGYMAVDQNLSACQDFVRNSSIDRYVFDLTGLDLIDSTGAAMLIRLVRDIHEHDAMCLAYGVNQSVAELLNLLGMDEYVFLCADERSALLRARKPPAVRNW
jgi:anti-anti-sigma factor